MAYKVPTVHLATEPQAKNIKDALRKAQEGGQREFNSVVFFRELL